MKKHLSLTLLSLLLCSVTIAQSIVKDEHKTIGTQWDGKKVAYLGDSMTDPHSTATTAWYWQYLKQLMNIDHYVYARSGYQWTNIYQMAEKLYNERGQDIDAIIIWAGTNDYRETPIGEFFTEKDTITNYNGNMVVRKYRMHTFTDSTFCGRINRVMSFLKTNYPDKQIIIMTPIHRGYANFSEKNVQPDENFTNATGIYLEPYIEALKAAGQYWSVPVIDLNSLSGLYPVYESNTPYINKEYTDRLHPNAAGHYRLARTIQYQLLTLPVGF
ncbi:SGNH/GDSL hydrolase family protein [Bacteroides sp. 519]|uniref:SGNH/GDSL hydrolase family protein n=1 Tax=Bacteroides sp. 519 TaxID=2302937 RepID=UPI0013CF7765|nr:SGNH/GDSL hydrolase family protein [Bacteroides sp. 519]NDV59479.1 SGNH/GDSL hydrolase family protein [Bacteroides sp. 519]